MSVVSLLAFVASGCGGDRTWSDVSQVASPQPSVSASGEAEKVGGRLAGGTLSDKEWQRAIAAVRPVTFMVFNHGCSFDATGSAVAISPTGLVTNRHVVEGARTLEVRAMGEAHIGVTSWTVSQQDDLALLKLASPIAETPVALATDPTPGDLVAALGYPLGGHLTAGRGRVVDVADDSDSSSRLTASMDVLPGNSGGPLVDTEGRLVGVVRAIDLSEGWAIAVPVERVKDLLNERRVETGQPCRG